MGRQWTFKFENKLNRSGYYSLCTQWLVHNLKAYPSVICRKINDTYAIQNISLSGAGTTDRVNGVVVGKALIGPKLPQKLTDIPKTKERSIYVEPLQLPVYNVGIRQESALLPIIKVNLDLNTQEMSSKKNFICFLCRYSNKENQKISSWTGFNIKTRIENLVLWDTVGYLPTIDSPAIAMNTIFEVLMKAWQTKDELKLKHVVVVFDQVIYAKPVEIM